MTSKLKLFSLYATQGIPYGFQNLISVIVRTWGSTYDKNAFIQLTYLPWVIRPLIAPHIENAGQSLLIKSLFSLGIIQFLTGIAVLNKSVNGLIILLLLSNCLASFYDIVVDKMAIAQRKDDVIDSSNAIQVIGYRCGALLSGGSLIYLGTKFFSNTLLESSLSPFIGSILIFSMAFFLWYEDKSTNEIIKTQENKYQNLRNAYDAILKHFKRNPTLYMLIFTYKAGESIGDNLFKHFIRDNGSSMLDITLLKIISESISILGSLIMVKTTKQSASVDKKRLSYWLVINIIPQLLRGIVVCNSSLHKFPILVVVSLIEHFIGGALTVACFNFMFSHVLENIEGTHYSVYAATEVLGKTLFGYLAFTLVDILGHPKTFIIAIVLSIVPLLFKQDQIRQDIF